MEKICTKCKISKQLDEFYVDNRNKKYGRSARCKICTPIRFYPRSKESRSEYYKRRRKEVPEIFKANNKRYWDKLDLATKIFKQARGRAKRKGILFDISISDIIIPEKCPLLEIELVRGTKNNYSQTHSLDRIDSFKGYQKENIQVLSMKANTMKNSATLEELLIFSKNIILQNKNHPLVLELEKLLNLK